MAKQIKSGALKKRLKKQAQRSGIGRTRSAFSITIVDQGNNMIMQDSPTAVAIMRSVQNRVKIIGKRGRVSGLRAVVISDNSNSATNERTSMSKASVRYIVEGTLTPLAVLNPHGRLIISRGKSISKISFCGEVNFANENTTGEDDDLKKRSKNKG